MCLQYRPQYSMQCVVYTQFCYHKGCAHTCYTTGFPQENLLWCVYSPAKCKEEESSKPQGLFLIVYL